MGKMIFNLTNISWSYGYESSKQMKGLDGDRNSHKERIIDKGFIYIALLDA